MHRDLERRRPSPSAAFSLVACAALVCLTGCQKDKPSAQATQLGEPIGAQVPARGDAPPITIAFAVAKGSDPVPLLPPLVSAVAGAMSGCPAFPKEAERGVTAIDFTIEGGKMKVPGRPESPGAKCLATALDGKDLGAPSATPLGARIELKVGAKP
jgi:hypothetical protein